MQFQVFCELNAPALYCQIRARQSPEPVANLPEEPSFSPVNATLMTEFLCPCSIMCVIDERGSQNCTERSLDPETNQFPSGENATESTKSRCQLRVLRGRGRC